MQVKLRSLGTTLMAVLVASGVMIAGADIAQAVPTAPKDDQNAPVKVITEAIPGTNTVVTDAGVRSASITLPGTVSQSASASYGNVPQNLFSGEGEPVLNTTLKDAVISSYSTGNGTQTLINIASSSASHEYRFPLALPAGSKAALEADGSVAVRTANGEVIGGFKAPWAYDANGKPVPTSFSLEGDVLVQFVRFDDKTAFPVVADPSDFWGWTVCVATVTGEIAGNVFLAGKVAQLVKRFGSIQRAFEIMFRAWNSSNDWNKKLQAVAAATGGIAGEIIGVNSIKAACFDS